MLGVCLIESSSAQLRLQDARTFVEANLARGDVWIVSASRGAADDLARAIAMDGGATIGLHRFSMTQLALRLAAPVLVDLERAPATFLGSEAVAARATFDALNDGELSYFEPVARTPGFPRALARTVYELRLAAVEPERLAGLPLGGHDLSALLHGFEAQFERARAIDRAALFEASTRSVSEHKAPVDAAVLLLDVPIDSEVELRFVESLLRAASSSQLPASSLIPDPGSVLPGPRSLITVPFGDIATLNHLETLGLN
ncbi:MAG TPA: hypothetical protein VH138_14030, partial [Vicinamibacterales bacterium]|nr:hypothetical protein [Vicinamibacterales bacterium]